MFAGIINRKASAKSVSLVLSVLLVLAMLISRGVSIKHGMSYHPDERVLFSAARSLSLYVTGQSEDYVERKEYPEGAIVFQLPFHIAADLTSRVSGEEYDPQLISRIAGAFYFTCAGLTGLAIIRRFFHSGISAEIIYALTIVFSLFHIEQSRYATGEPVIAFVLMLLIFCTAESIENESRSVLSLLSFFLSGVLASVKYPLILFSLLPIYALTLRIKNGYCRRRLPAVIAGIAMIIVGFMLFSPKAALDPEYIIRVTTRELSTYFDDSLMNDVGGTWNHFIYAALYLTFYSGLPLMPVFFAGQCFSGHYSEKGRLFKRILPIVVLVFLFYNLFVRIYFVRTLYPFLLVSDLYAAAFAGRIIDRGGMAKAVTLLIAVFMVLRGGALIYAMSESQEEIRDNFYQKVISAVDESWNKTTIIYPGFSVPIDESRLKNVSYRYISSSEDYLSDEDFAIEPGELVIALGLDYSHGTPYILPIDNYPVEEMQRKWISFNEVNAGHFQNRAYPPYYYLFGFWVKGTTGTNNEFPSNKIFYTSLP